MEYLNTYYNQTLHTIKFHWKSLIEGSSGKSYFDGFIYSFVYNCIMRFYIQAVNELEMFWQYWKRLAINQDHPPFLTTTGESSSSVPLSDYITYDDKGSSTGFSNYPIQEKIDTITADTNLPDRVEFNTKTSESHSSFTSFSSNPTMIQQSNETATALAPYYELLTNLYQSGLDFLCPPEKITKCAISVTSPDKQQRLINFSRRVKKDWTTPHQLLELDGEIKCTQIRTREREYTIFLFYFFTISLFLNVTYGIYQRRKYRKSQNNNAAPLNQAQKNSAPNPRNNQDNIVPDPRDNQANIVLDPGVNQEEPRDNQEEPRDNQEDPRGNQEDPLVSARFYQAVTRNMLTPSELARLVEVQTRARLNRRAPDQSNPSLGSTLSSSNTLPSS